MLTVVALIGALATMFFVAASGATLANSTFNTSNGDLTSTATNPNLHDWNPASGANLGPVEPINCTSSPTVNCGVDKVNDSTDQAFGQGAKEDDVAPSVVTGSIPPSKDDLSRFYVNKEKAGGDDFLYLAWERSNLLGSAHMDFEFNQSSDPSANGVTRERTEGDMLIDFDFGGSGVPGLFLHRWITDDGVHTAAECEASNTLPCWDEAVDLTAGGFAEGSVNGADVTDNNPPGNPRTLDGETKTSGQGTISSEFGEAAINLTDSGVFAPGVCAHFGSAMLKSRSSGNSFSSELKDFIAPIPVNISNCGTLIIKKVTIPSPDPTNPDQSFPFSVNGANPPNTSLPKTFSLTNGNTNSTTVFAGTFSASETTVPAGWVLVAAQTSCDDGSGTLAGSTISGISVSADETVTCTFTNQLNQGAILITKLGKYKNCSTANAAITVGGSQIGVCGPTGAVTTAKLGNAAFRVSTDEAGSSPLSGSPFTTSNSTGTVCIDGLSWSGTGTDYWVAETGAPLGYSNDNSTAVKVTVTQNATCNAGKTAIATGTGATYSPTDTPLTNITVSVASVRAGATNSSISCVVSGTTTNIGNSRQPASGRTDPVAVHADGTNSTNPVNPGIYVCTIDVDP